jgi:lipopolysaccharide biosynthesis glycosyltransferase
MQSNEFAFSRWLVPWMSGYQGWALWLDCDMLFQRDIVELFEHADPHKAVQVVKHNHKPKEVYKYLGNKQSRYERKNWSSVMLFNCAHEANHVLTPQTINVADGLGLHQFNWLDDEFIGELPHEWNVLAGYDSPEDYPSPANIHYTIGGPYFHEYRNIDWADEWMAERNDMLHCTQSADTHRSEVAAVV